MIKKIKDVLMTATPKIVEWLLSTKNKNVILNFIAVLQIPKIMNVIFANHRTAAIVAIKIGVIAYYASISLHKFMKTKDKKI